MQLGQKVTFTRQYKRTYVYNGTPPARCRDGREWKVFDREGTGVYLGTRTLQNGRVDRDEDGSYFIRESCFEAALICPGTRINPIYVPLDAFTLHPECWSLAY